MVKVHKADHDGEQNTIGTNQYMMDAICQIIWIECESKPDFAQYEICRGSLLQYGCEDRYNWLNCVYSTCLDHECGEFYNCDFECTLKFCTPEGPG